MLSAAVDRDIILPKEILNRGKMVFSVFSSWGRLECLGYCGRESERALKAHQFLGPTNITGIHEAQFGTLRLRSRARTGVLREGQ